MELLTREEVVERLGVLEDCLDDFANEITTSDDAEVDRTLDELEALYWLNDIYYLEDEGFLEITEEQRCYTKDSWCPSFP